MKVSKSQAILYIVLHLLEKGSVNKEEVMSAISISDLTFRRYIQEIRAYLINFNEPLELVYNKSSHEYILKKVI